MGRFSDSIFVTFECLAGLGSLHGLAIQDSLDCFQNNLLHYKHCNLSGKLFLKSRVMISS